MSWEKTLFFYKWLQTFHNFGVIGSKLINIFHFNQTQNKKFFCGHKKITYLVLIFRLNLWQRTLFDQNKTYCVSPCRPACCDISLTFMISYVKNLSKKQAGTEQSLDRFSVVLMVWQLNWEQRSKPNMTFSRFVVQGFVCIYWYEMKLITVKFLTHEITPGVSLGLVTMFGFKVMSNMSSMRLSLAQLFKKIYQNIQIIIMVKI